MSRSRLAAMLVAGVIGFSGWAVPAHAALKCFGREATILGGEGDDTLTGTPGPDVIVSRGGRDTITAKG
jgi:Ca2+-binding RTX toxin-like protein